MTHNPNTNTEAGAVADVAAIAGIRLECTNCSRKLGVAREPTDPPNAVYAKLQCNLCDDGDRHAPEFFGADGKWIHPTEHLEQGATAGVAEMNEQMFGQGD